MQDAMVDEKEFVAVQRKFRSVGAIGEGAFIDP